MPPEHAAVPAPASAPARFAAAAGFLALGYVVFHAALTVGLRVLHPFQIEWSEGTSFLQGVVLREEGLLYPHPWEAWFVPHIYPPLHAVLMAAVSWVAGDHLPAGRAVSLGATAAAAAIGWRWARELGASRAAAAAGVLSFLAAFRATGQWFDLVRVDMVFLVPFLLCVRALLAPGGPRPVAGALWLAAAALAKQTALFYAPPLALLVLLREGWAGCARFLGAFALAVGAWMGLLHVLTGGWSTFYLLVAPGGHPVNQWGTVARDLPALLLFLAPVVLALALRRDRVAADLALLALVSASLSALALAKHGGFHNAWLPLCAGAIPCAALVGARAPLGVLVLGAVALGLHAVTGGFAAGVFHDHLTVPTARDRRAMEDAAAQVGALEGAVWVADDPWTGYKAGKGIGSLRHLINELVLPDFLPDPLVGALEGRGPRALAAVVFAESPLFHPGADPVQGPPEKLVDLVRRHFRPEGGLRYPDAAAGLTRVGLSIRPGSVHVRRRP